MSDDVEESKRRFLSSLCKAVSSEFDTHARAFVMSLSEENKKEYNCASSALTLLVEMLCMLNPGVLRGIIDGIQDENFENKQKAFEISKEAIIDALAKANYVGARS